MKYFSLVLFGAFLLLSSCETAVSSGGDAVLATRSDSLSYAFGYYSVKDPNRGLEKMGIHLNPDEYLKGYNYMESADLSDQEKEEAFSALMKLSRDLQVRQGRPYTEDDQPSVSLDSFSFSYGAFNAETYLSCGYKVNKEAACAGFRDGYKGISLIDENELENMALAFNNGLREAQIADSNAKGEANKMEGEKFLAENKTKPGVKVTESGLQYKVLRKGDSPRSPKATSTVKVHYEGRLLDGTIFDSSYEKGRPLEYPVGNFISGWIEGLQLMTIGDKFQLYIPSELAYKERGSGPIIGPHSTLVFDMELLDILE